MAREAGKSRQPLSPAPEGRSFRPPGSGGSALVKGRPVPHPCPHHLPHLSPLLLIPRGMLPCTKPDFLSLRALVSAPGRACGGGVLAAWVDVMSSAVPLASHSRRPFPCCAQAGRHVHLEECWHDVLEVC